MTKPSLTEEQVYEIGMEAYIYLYPLILMDVTRRLGVNVEPGKAFGRGPMNLFTHVPAFPPADFRDVVRPNFDTLYSIAWLDLTKGPMVVTAADYDAVHQVQAGYTAVPLSHLGKEPPAVKAVIDPSVDMKTPPMVQVDTMPAARYFSYGADLMCLHPPHITDQPIVARMRRIGIDAGKPFDLDKADPTVKRALEQAAPDALQAMRAKIPTLARLVNGWAMNTDTVGTYGTYYLKRAILALVGLGANLPEDAIYPMHQGDAEGKSLTGAGSPRPTR